MRLDDDGDELEHRQDLAARPVPACQLLDLGNPVVEVAHTQPAEGCRAGGAAEADEPVRGEDLPAAPRQLRCLQRGGRPRAAPAPGDRSRTASPHPLSRRRAATEAVGEAAGGTLTELSSRGLRRAGPHAASKRGPGARRRQRRGCAPLAACASILPSGRSSPVRGKGPGLAGPGPFAQRGGGGI